MKTLHGFTHERHINSVNHIEVYVDKGTDVVYNSWQYDDRALSGISVNITIHKLSITIDVDSGFIFTQQEIDKIYNRDTAFKKLKL